jgi:RimJ/RimL family protein N-acetyltransferase
MSVTLSGFGLTLSPLTPSDAEELFAVSVPEQYRYFPMAPTPWTAAGLTAFIMRRLSKGEEPWAIRRGGLTLGTTAFLIDDRPNGVIEIGHTWLVPSARRTAVNPGIKMLTLTEAFEARGAQRVTLKCDARNQRSRRAIQRLGAVPEGALRSVMPLGDGTRRTTAYYSILADEWPHNKERLQYRLANE